MDPDRIGLVRRINPRSAVRTAFGAFTLALFAFAAPSARAQDDLPTRVGRIADLGGEVYHAPEDRASDWSAIGLNYPITSGDNLWVAQGGRAEIDVGAGQVRLGPETNLNVARLDDRTVALFLAQGQLSLRLRVLDPDEVARIDTPNTQVVVTRPGLYRIEVSADRSRTVLVVREGEATLPTSAGMQQVLPGQTAVAEGLDATRVDVRNGVATDGFDTWVAERDRRYSRHRSASYVSRDMVGAADLDDYGTWESNATYGSVWYPTQVDAGWAPYRNGSWTWVSPWGWTWVDAAPWGYAPFHYGRWVVVGGRWGWCPGRFVARPVWSPAMVGWVGGPGWGLSVSWGAPVYGWVPLAWGEPFRPWWNQCSSRCWNNFNQPYAARVDDHVRRAPPPHYVNAARPGGVTAVPSTAFAGGKPVYRNLVPVSAAQVASAPNLGQAPSVERIARGRPGVKPDLGAMPAPAASYDRNGSRGAVTVPRAANAAPGAMPESARRAAPAYPAAPPTSYAAPGAKPAPSMYTTPVQRESVQTYAPSRNAAAQPATVPVQRESVQTYAPSRNAAAQPTMSPGSVPPPTRYAAPPAPTVAPAAPQTSQSRQRHSAPADVASGSLPMRTAPSPQPVVVPPTMHPQAAPRSVPAAPMPQPQAVVQAPPQQAVGRPREGAKPAHDGGKPSQERAGGGEASGRGNAIEKPGGGVR